MPGRRVIAIWFPYMGAERIFRKTQHSLGKPVVVVAKKSQSEVISSISAAAQYKGLLLGNPYVTRVPSAHIYSYKLKILMQKLNS